VSYSTEQSPLSVNFVRGVREVLQRREDRKYDSIEQRQEAYKYLHTTFCRMFERLSDKVSVVPGSTDRRLSVELKDIGIGTVHEQGGGSRYRLHIIGKPVSERYGGHFTESRHKQAVIETDGLTATIQQGSQGERYSDNWSPKTGDGYWDTFNKLDKPKPLAAPMANILAIELSLLQTESATKAFVDYPNAEQ
jgi:hypothetical protein